jgi:dihydrofolate synthase/folylpolyglutamate synthase
MNVNPETSEEIIERLMMLHDQYIDMGLTRILRLLEALGRPQDKLPPVIHIAGTNGKGSTLATLKAIFEASGKSIHCFVSPHLVHYHERIVLQGKPISENFLIENLLEIEKVNAGQDITHFELTTAVAFLAYSRVSADVLLLEVGLGGRQDSTNVVDHPALAVITPVALDHQQFLGNDIATIAADKSGIMKRGTPAVIGPQSDEGLGAIRSEAEKLGVEPSFNGQDWTVFEEHGRMVYQDTRGLLDLPLPSLLGRHQISNAGTAIAAIRALEDTLIPDPNYEDGIKNTTWPARFERLTAGPLIEMAGKDAELWLDGGHNPHAAEALAEALATLEENNPRPLYLVMAMMARKDAAGFLGAFSGLAKQVSTLVVPGEDNTWAAEDLAGVAREVGLAAAAMPDLETALQDVAAREKTPRILICGSLYLAGHALRLNGQLNEENIGV